MQQLETNSVLLHTVDDMQLWMLKGLRKGLEKWMEGILIKYKSTAPGWGCPRDRLLPCACPLGDMRQVGETFNLTWNSHSYFLSQSLFYDLNQRPVWSQPQTSSCGTFVTWDWSQTHPAESPRPECRLYEKDINGNGQKMQRTWLFLSYPRTSPRGMCKVVGVRPLAGSRLLRTFSLTVWEKAGHSHS